MKINTKKLVLLAMLTALAYLMVTLIRIPVVLFLSYEPKDVIITIAGFLLGPMASLIIALLVALLEMVTYSTTGVIGCIMNLLSTAAFSCIAAWIYKKRRTVSGAVVGLVAGTLAMITIMLLWNWLITPLYMGVDRDTVVGMLLPVFLPFNALKAGFNSALTLALYKPLVGALRKTGLVEPPKAAARPSKAGVYVFAGVVLITCILLLLVMRGIL